jgi:hypothetical protein
MERRGGSGRSGVRVGCLVLAGTLASGCAPRENTGEAIVRLPPPVYCYRTLAEADCFASPLAGEAYRLIAYQ